MARQCLYMAIVYYQLVIPMGKLVTISAKISKELKERADELAINISALVRRALEEEVKKRELRRALEGLEEGLRGAPELPEGAVVGIIRDMREGRAVVE
ncbi:MAG: type II toxin-antitoxin system CcdA family antitoxin [Candidatus Bathyarchaeia archaeon]